MKEYPYYVIPDIQSLKTEKDPDELRRIRRRVAANIGDPDAQRAILGDASEDFHDFYGDSVCLSLSTEDTIDSFLDMFGGLDAGTSVTANDPLQANSPDPIVPVAPAIDYALQLELEGSGSQSSPLAPSDATFGAIDAYLSDNPPSRIKPKKEIKEPEMPSLTESFAKILIKNGNYSRALEIITQISLNNPEKSIYFADQIRFLKKIIMIQGR